MRALLTYLSCRVGRSKLVWTVQTFQCSDATCLNKLLHMLWELIKGSTVPGMTYLLDQRYSCMQAVYQRLFLPIGVCLHSSPSGSTLPKAAQVCQRI